MLQSLKYLTSMLVLLISCTESRNHAFPKRDGDRLYTTDTTFYIMAGDDTLSKLLNERTLKLGE